MAHAGQHVAPDGGSAPALATQAVLARPPWSMLLPSWAALVAYMAVSSLSCVCSLAAQGGADPSRVARLGRLARFSVPACATLLVLHVALALRRWRALRVGSLGELWAASCDMALLLAAHLGGGTGQNGADGAGELVTRYAAASLELALLQAADADGMLAGLVGDRLLSGEERRKLEDLTSKPQAMWVWVAVLCQRLAGSGRLSSRFLAAAHRICARARGSLGRGQGAFALLDTQAPLPYVHMLSLVVHACCLVLAVKCGAASAAAVGSLAAAGVRGSAAGSVQVLVNQGALMLGVPLLLHCMLRQICELGGGPSDCGAGLPLHTALSAECGAVRAAGARLPAEAADVVRSFEPRAGEPAAGAAAAAGEGA